MFERQNKSEGVPKEVNEDGETISKEMEHLYQLGDWVIFTDEFGEEQTSRIVSLNAYGQKGALGIEGTYGTYCRKPEEVRLAERHEIHKEEWRRSG